MTRHSGNRLSDWMGGWRRAMAERGAEIDPLAAPDRLDPSFEDTWRAALKKRVLIVVLGLVCWSAAIEARLVVLQVVEHADLVAQADRQRQHSVPIPAKRGDIVDRNGEMLALSVDTDGVFVMPKELKDSASAITRLCGALGGCTAADQAWIDRINRRAAYTPVRSDVTPAELARVKALKLEGVGFNAGTRRFYPNIELAAHVLGFVGNENHGLKGIEQRYDSIILGRQGHMQVDMDALNHTLEMRVDQAPTAGATLELTIDESMQHFAERFLQEGVVANRALGGSAIVMDPHTGEILALANYPMVNPNAFNSFSGEEWKNRATENQYEPGSTFKMVTASAAIEEGVMKIDDIVDCNPGYITFPGRKPITEAHGVNHGALTFEDVIVHSSNIGAIRIGLKVGADRLFRYVRRFGFGEALAPDFAGQNAGMVGLPPNDSALASMSMGYQVAVTPLQMAAAVSAVANGGTLYQPHVVRAVVRDGVRRVFEPTALRRAINPETAATVTGIMEAVAQRGTGTKAQLINYQVAGKTGTAAKLVDKMVGDVVRKGYSTTDYNASFVGFVPSRKPAFVIVVVVDTPKAGMTYGGDVAAPIFQRLADAALRLASVPATINPTRPVIVAPASSAAVATASAPLLTPNVAELAGQALVPDVRGLSARDALRILSGAGLNMRMVGSGVVVEQTPAAGSPLERGGFGLLRFSRGAQDANAGGSGR